MNHFCHQFKVCVIYLFKGCSLQSKCLSHSLKSLTCCTVECHGKGTGNAEWRNHYVLCSLGISHDRLEEIKCESVCRVYYLLLINLSEYIYRITRLVIFIAFLT